MNSSWLDQPKSVRAGEELSIELLQNYFKTHFPEIRGPIEITQFPGGHSNLTYCVKSGTQEYVLRRPPFGAKIKSAHDMGREFKILSRLIKVYEKLPHPLIYCEDESVIGAPFYLMERVQGVILRREPPAGLALTRNTMERLSESFIDNLVEIHSLDLERTGLNELGHPQGYIERQITGWTERYQKARTDEIPELVQVAAWLQENQPIESGVALIHNDYKYDNLVLNPEKLAEIRAVLDWEMATVGDPLMDLGCTLSYWVDPSDPAELQALRFCPTTLPGNSTRAQLAERYFQQLGKPVVDMLFYYVYGLFKLAVIIQQIYARYARGFTRDERFAHLNLGVRALGAVAEQAIGKRSIS
ncbi:phosphotransferase family protein [Candidatus Acetothermia bacterium]|nr:phosphotransferase family protein [Candidatus Acetothermia bacterium]MBI3643687.1 phosphotransferase family protein [Candidatus Acetothermia bacterium]